MPFTDQFRKFFVPGKKYQLLIISELIKKPGIPAKQ